MAATQELGHSTLMEFSTQPTWLYNTSDWSYPQDPFAVQWNYPRGNSMPNTTTLLAQYFGRLANYFINGQFTDEFGIVHKATRKWPIQYWEIFNEPDGGCHGLGPQEYTLQYDAIVKEIRRVADPNKKIKFFGLALANSYNIPWFQYFLDPKNHDPAVSLDYITFHFYANAIRTNVSQYEGFFTQADNFFPTAKQIFGIRDSLNPTVKTDMNEVGIILSDDNNPNAPLFPLIYWNAASSYHVYMWGNLMDMGLDVIGMSQLAGSPPIPEWGIPDAQFPSVAMMNWTNGEGTPRFWTLKLLLDKFQPGDQWVAVSNSSPDSIYVRGMLCGPKKTPRLVVANKKNASFCLSVPKQFKSLTVIDQTTLFTSPKTIPIANNEVVLLPFGWAVLE
jgi:hypothetical protein